VRYQLDIFSRRDWFVVANRVLENGFPLSLMRLVDLAAARLQAVSCLIVMLRCG
jgi:hypothetical protein